MTDTPNTDVISEVPPVIETTAASPDVPEERLTFTMNVVSQDKPIVIKPMKTVYHNQDDLIASWLKGEVEEDAVLGDVIFNYARNRAAVLYGEEMRLWAREDILETIRTGIKPKKTRDGVLLNSTRRPTLRATEWSRGELMGFLRNEIPATEIASEDLLFDSCRVKFGIPLRTPNHTVRDIVLHGRKPEVPVNNFLKEDRVRQSKPLRYWSMEELQAWCRGDIKLNRNVKESDAVKELRRRFNIQSKVSDDMIKNMVIGIKKESIVKMNKLTVISNLQCYLANMMDLRKLTPAEAGKMQSLLCTTIENTLRIEDEQEFIDTWTVLLDCFFDNSQTVFSMSNALVHSEEIRDVSTARRNNFERMYMLLMTTANPETRLKQNTKLFEYYLEYADEAARNRIALYYQLT